MSKRGWTIWAIAAVLAAGAWAAWWHFTPSPPLGPDKGIQEVATPGLPPGWEPFARIALYGSALVGWILILRFVIRSFRSGFGVAWSCLLVVAVACLVGATVLAQRIGNDGYFWWQTALLDTKLVVGLAAFATAVLVYALRRARVWSGPNGTGTWMRSATVWSLILFVLFASALARADVELSWRYGPEFLHPALSGLFWSVWNMDAIIEACNRYADRHDRRIPAVPSEAC